MSDAATTAPSRPRVLSGIQPTADSFHFGNYLGALRQWVSLQEDHEPYFFIADLHAITAEQDPKVLRSRFRRAAAQLLAMGVNPERATVFIQSHVPAHTQLQWVLAGLTGFGEASRMTQFKHKSAKGGTERATVGLFTYPILQAADILLYRPHYVPVGEDQRQHLELTRDLAGRFNHRYGKTFRLPEPYILKETAKIADLQDPAAKMSKSASSDAGISNLLTIYSGLTGRSVPDLEKEYVGRGYGDFKKDLADVVVDFVTPFRNRTLELLEDHDQLDDVLRSGADRANAVAEQTLSDVYDRIGLVPRDR